MIFRCRQGRVTPARFVSSPNCDDRPAGVVADTIVIHCISLPPGCYGGGEIESFFCNCLDAAAHPYFREIEHLNVSAHFLIRRDGALTQFVPTDKRAWHAGASCFRGRSNVNDFSIGIELEGTDDSEFDERQYATLTALTSGLIVAHPDIDIARLVGHSEIAPGRKTDPGPGFDWDRYRESLE